MRNRSLGWLVPILLVVGLAHATSAAACKVNDRWPLGTPAVQYYPSSVNSNFGDWGSIFRDADNDACAAQAVYFFNAKMYVQSLAQGWTSWLNGGDVYLMTSAALRLGARGLLSSNVHSQILTALSQYYNSTVGSGCSISGGNGCMDEYSVAAAGYAWAGAYLWLTQSTAGFYGYGEFIGKAQDYIGRSLSPYYSVCIHHIHPRPGAGSDACSMCTADYNPGHLYYLNHTDLRTRIANGDTEVLSYEHNFENPSYGAGLLTSVATAALGMRRAGAAYSPSDFERVVAHGLLRNGQVHAKPGATSCDLSWTHDYCTGNTCAMTGLSCITLSSCAPPQNQPCYDKFGDWEYDPGMFPIRGLLTREYSLSGPGDLILPSPSYQFDQFNGLCMATPFQTYFPNTYNDFFNDGRWAAYYTLPVVWSASSYYGDPQPRLAGVDPVQHVDNPTPFPSQPVHSGANSFNGWAFDGLGSISSASFAFKVDGQAVTLQGFSYGSSRWDVCSYYGITNSSCLFGWTGTYTPPAGFWGGWHTFEATVTSSAGSVSRFTRNFYFIP
jgi:hypothetical protein